MTTQSECQKGTISQSYKEWWFLWYKNYYIGNALVKYNSNSGAINRGDVIPSGNRISSGKQTVWKEEFIGLSLKYLWSEKKN
jgi:hypothetical protein